MRGRTHPRASYHIRRTKVWWHHIHRRLQLDSTGSLPLRGWHGPDAVISNTAPAHDWGVPTMERAQPYEIQSWETQDHDLLWDIIAKNVITTVPLPSDTQISPWQSPHPVAARRTKWLHLSRSQARTTNDNGAGNETHLPKDQVGLPNSFRNRTQP